MRDPRLVAALAALVVSGVASRANAYLLDLSDATVAGRGDLELELQPIGYLGSVDDQGEHLLVAPSINAVVGLDSGWDVTLTARGLVDLDAGGWGLGQQGVMFRVLLLDGAYSGGDFAGPSLALQWGTYLPDVGRDGGGLAPSVALLASQAIDDASVHLHAELILTPERQGEVFVSAVLQAPPTWAVQPVAELWVDAAGEEVTVSGLLGAIVPLGEDLAIEAGVRLAGFDEVDEIEGRLALLWATRWLPEPG